jgi:aminoglycoside phosphotransferase (APT) family kinase protein
MTDLIGARRSDRRRLAEAVALVPEMLRQAAHQVPIGDRRARIVRAELTSTAVAVIILADGGSPCAVVKVPMTPQAVEGIRRESRTLEALHSDDRLGDFRRLIPRPYASGTALGRHFRVDSALPGTAAVGPIVDEVAMGRLLEAAAETIHILHQRSADSVHGYAVVDEWVGARAVAADTHGALARDRGRRVASLLHGLRSAVSSNTFKVGWVHGDYWAGNLLFDGRHPAGIIDWDAATPAELPAIDLLHLLLYGRRLAGAGELGEIVARQLLHDEWSALERRLLVRYAGWGGHGALPPRQALLLYWLRHVAHHERQETRPDGIRHRRWVRRNIRPVLGTI